MCVELPLEIMAAFLYLTRVLFSLLITAEGIYLFLNVTCFFFYLIRLTELFLVRGRSTRKINHCTYYYYICIFFTFSLPLKKKTFPTIKFYIQLYIDSLYQGSFLRPTCQNNSSAAFNLQVINNKSWNPV